MNGKNSHNFRVFANFLAFLILIVVAILAIVGKFSQTYTSFSAVLEEISKILCYFVISFSSLWYVLSKRNVIIKIIWLVSVVVIFVLMFL